VRLLFFISWESVNDFHYFLLPFTLSFFQKDYTFLRSRYWIWPWLGNTTETKGFLNIPDSVSARAKDGELMETYPTCPESKKSIVRILARRYFFTLSTFPTFHFLHFDKV